MARIDYKRIGAEPFKRLGQLSEYGKSCSVDLKLIELVKLRASQINGCANCIQLHTRTLRKLGETDERMHLVSAWDEAPSFSERERAALAWAEAVTLVADGHVPDAVYEQARTQFSEQELVDLTFAIVTINAHNRLAIAFRVDLRD
jgi:AhpD family alkylhydroperoxidase